jgi:hypothetical protein
MAAHGVAEVLKQRIEPGTGADLANLFFDLLDAPELQASLPASLVGVQTGCDFFFGKERCVRPDFFVKITIGAPFAEQIAQEGCQAD